MLFDREANAVRVKYQITIDGINGLDLYTVMNAMDVSKTYLASSNSSLILNMENIHP